MFTNLLRKQDADCKCGHTPDQHSERAGSCSASDTVFAFKKTDWERACTCQRYRGGLLVYLIENL